MNNKIKLSLLLAMMLMGTPCMAQTDQDAKKQELRKRNFAEFLIYWTEWDAFIDISQFDKSRAKRDSYEEAKNQIPNLVRDSTYYANEISAGAGIINDKYTINQQPDLAFTMYEIKQAYKDRHTDKNSAEYILGKNMKEYEKILKELKLARYTISINEKQK